MRCQSPFPSEVTLSRRRRTKPTAPRKSRTSSCSVPLAGTSRQTASTIDEQDAYRLAVIEIDNGGSVGSALALFEQAAAKVAQRTVPLREPGPDEMRAEAATIRRQVREARELAGAAAVLREAELEAAALRRRLERTIAAEQRRLDRERRRSEGGLYAGQPRSDNRPTRLAVDAGAWEALKAEAIRRRSSVGYLAGKLVVDAVRHNKLPRVGEHRGATQRFARLVLVDAETWTAFRSMAFDAHVTTTRMVGVLVEREARQLGWTR